MITADGYSKDPNIIPEGIVITWSMDLINEKGGLLSFIRFFEKNMTGEDDTFLNKCKNKPAWDDSLISVYIIVAGRLRYKCYYAGWEAGEPTEIFNANGNSWASSIIRWPRVRMVGPFEKCPFKRKLRGFQGFRYCTKLF